MVTVAAGAGVGVGAGAVAAGGGLEAATAFLRAVRVHERAEMTAVYRTYLDTRTGTPSPQDVAHVQEAIEEAGARRPDLAPELFEFLCVVLLMRYRGPAEDRFVLRRENETLRAQIDIDALGRENATITWLDHPDWR